MKITRIKVPRWLYAALYRMAFELMRRAYPACPTVLRADHAGDYHCHTTNWVDEGTQIVGYLRPINEKLEAR